MGGSTIWASPFPGPAQPTISLPLLGLGSLRVRSPAWLRALGSARLVIMPTAPTLVPPMPREQ